MSSKGNSEKCESPTSNVKKKQSKLDKLFNPPPKSEFSDNKSKKEKIKLLDSSIKPSSPVKLSEKPLLEQKVKATKLSLNGMNGLGESSVSNGVVSGQIVNFISDLSDEYQGLSYKSGKATPVKSPFEDKVEPVKKKSIEKDFRIKYKTEKCKFFESGKECKFGENCAFAHGSEDIREKIVISSNYKTKRCKQFFELGYCPYGSRCQFLHRESPKSSSLCIPSFSYIKTFSELANPNATLENFMVEEKICSRPRLKTFENLAKEKEVAYSKFKLYEDILSIRREDIYLYDLSLVKDPDVPSRSRFMSA